MSTRVASVTVRPEQSIRELMRVIDRGAKGIAFIVDDQSKLLGTVTDGDVRRAILANVQLDEPTERLLRRKRESAYPEAITAAVGTPADVLLETMKCHSIRQIPLLDAHDRLVDFATLDELVGDSTPAMRAVIMAGGFGARLFPLTQTVPKPMLPVGVRPLMELTVEQLRLAGIHRVNVATHYLADQIVGHFGDGQEFGVQIDYLREDEPLGTAGALRLLPAGDEPLLVINGDVLTRVDFRALLAFHREQRAELTVGVRAYEIEVPYGVVHCQGARVTRLEEKPHYQFLVNAGIYLLEPEVQAAIPEGRRFDMTDLIEGLIDQGRSVVSFPIVEYWLDIGRLADYERANEDMNRGDLQR